MSQEDSISTAEMESGRKRRRWESRSSTVFRPNLDSARRLPLIPFKMFLIKSAARIGKKNAPPQLLRARASKLGDCGKVSHVYSRGGDL